MRKIASYPIILLVSLLLIPAESVQAQFDDQQIIEEAPGGNSVYATDLDGDGDNDVLSALARPNEIAWNENRGGGNFALRQTITTEASGASSVYASDLDNDGDPDVLSASLNDDKIAWYENDGDGNFGTQQVITTDANQAESVYAADLNGDGYADVLSASRGSNDKIAWYENDQDGGFEAQQVISTEADGAHSVRAADLDGDGDADVVSASMVDNKIAWYENDGSGSFDEQQVISSTANNARATFTADMDGDGDLDVLSASQGDNTIAWYENDGAGGFGTQHIITTQANDANDVYALDLDGDGDMDVISGGGRKIAWYENDGNGKFGGQLVITQNFPFYDSVQSIHIADVDEDGVVDLLSASFGDTLFGNRTGKITWYENEGVRWSGFVTKTTITTNAVEAQTITTADLDGDADLDALSASVGDDAVGWYENDGNGGFSTRQVITQQAEGAADAHPADLDGDGDFDVLSASLVDDKIAWYENDGNGAFGAQQVISTGANAAYAVHAADLDGDGDRDVLSASQQDDRIAWYENDGGEGFSTAQDITTNADGASDVFAADLDGDGDMDVLSASQQDNKVAWYENEGDGNFGGQRVMDSRERPQRPESVYAADLDGDDDLDVLVASSQDNTIAWYENNGSGGFERRPISTQAVGAIDVYAADIEGDGDLDVFSASAGDDKVAWYANDGTGSFGREQLVTASAPAGLRSVHAANLDGDGDLDVLSASEDANELVWYRNEKGGLLPVELVAFNARADEGRVVLRWKTGSETNNAGFEVYRRAAGSSFNQIGFVEGTGTTSQPQTYRYADADLPAAATRVTYRLRQVDYDGAFEYSPEVEVELDRLSDFVLSAPYPNPAQERTIIRYELPQAGPVRLEVYNVVGQRVAILAAGREKAGRKEVILDAQGLASGAYFLRLQASGRTLTRKLTVVR